MTANPDGVRLLACPFCDGSIDPPFENIRDAEDRDDTEDDFVKCHTIKHDCGTTGDAIWIEGKDSADCVRKWNTRAAPARCDAEAPDVRQEPDVVSQHLAWLNLYVGEMKPTNWRDMKDRMQSQLEQLSLALAVPPALPAREEVRRALNKHYYVMRSKDKDSGAHIVSLGFSTIEDAIEAEISIRALSPSSNGKPATENNNE